MTKDIVIVIDKETKTAHTEEDFGILVDNNPTKEPEHIFRVTLENNFSLDNMVDKKYLLDKAEKEFLQKTQEKSLSTSSLHSSEYLTALIQEAINFAESAEHPLNIGMLKMKEILKQGVKKK